MEIIWISRQNTTNCFIPLCHFAVYLDASDDCNMLKFNFANKFEQRLWNITIMQFDEDFINLAPQGNV